MKAYLSIPIILAIIACGPGTSQKGYLPVTEHPMFDSLLQLQFPDRQEWYSRGAFPIMFDDEYLPEDFLHMGAFYYAIHKFTSPEIAKIKQSLAGSQQILKHEKCCFICPENPTGTYRIDCTETEVPIPYFGSEREQLGIDAAYLSTDFDIYIIDAAEGLFIPSKNLIKHSCSDNWQHGFSRGVALSEQRGVAIYWVEFW